MLLRMAATHLCTRCHHEFFSAAPHPRCPSCGRTDTVEPQETSELMRDIWRQWLLVVAFLVIVGLVYLFFEATK